MQQIPHSRGFTLVELMITLVVAAILIAIAAPSMGQFIRENRAATQANHFLASLQLARSEAINRGVRVVIRANTSREWEKGWIIFTDGDDGNGNYATFNGDENDSDCNTINVDSQDCLLYFQEALPGDITLRSRPRHADWIAFLPTGKMRSSGGNEDVNNGTFFLCTNLDPDQSAPRHIILNNAGRAYIHIPPSKDKDGNSPACKHEN